MNGCSESISDKPVFGHLPRTLIDLNSSMSGPGLMFREDQRLPTLICDQTNGFQREDRGKVRIGHHSPGIRVVLSYQMPDPLACGITL
jgi:hypothetical protein